MKTSVKKIFFAISAAALLVSCDENDWNDKLDGFEAGASYDDAIEAEFTMTSTYYNAVASNSTNKALAGDELANALKAVGTNGMFSAQIPAKEYLPAFLASSSAPYFTAPEGSKVNVTYLECGETDPIIAEIAGSETYTVSKDDYISVWGSDEDYIQAFAPQNPVETKLPNVLKEAYPDAEVGDYVVVSYNESETNPVFSSDSETEEFAGGVFYLVADGSNAASPVVATKSYGYLSKSDASVADGKATTNAINAFMFIPADGGYYIVDAYGRYLYQSGTYDSFNLSATLPASGAVWTVDVASNGEATITNTAVSKWIQYDSSYDSYGSYDSARGTLPVLYKAEVQYYLVTEDGHSASPVTSGKSYGYLPTVDVTVTNGIVESANEDNAFTFENTTGGYNISDSEGRYLYMSGTYNSFNLSTELPETGAVWTISADETGALKIVNAETGKTVQYDSTYNSWGSYTDITGTLPKLYNAAATASSSSSSPAKAVASTPASAAKTAVYTYDGSTWAESEYVIALDAADYSAMGFSTNKLESPDVYLPLYLKNAKPYALSGDEVAVVYNGTSCSVLVYDGQNWTVNNNDLQTKVGQFVKNSDGWKFVKYVGKSYFNLATEVVLDHKYLIVAEGICATPISTSKSYGYLYQEAVTISGDVIEQTNEVNAFTFASTAVINDKQYTLPDGQFFIVDSNERYLYMTGSYTSFNVTDSPIEDGDVSSKFTWKAESAGDNTWKISNVGNGNWIQYASSYSSYGCYSVENGTLPSLYVLAEE